MGVIKGGKLAFVKAYGAADLTYGMPFTPETPTNIGSSSKQFTGFALALLASRGKISLDDDVRKHIPELKDFGKKITVRHLLTHTTGYREFINTLIIEGRQVLEGDYIAPDEVIKVINRQPTLQNEPGAEFNYNNSAFSLATIVVERVTGRPFSEWMRDEVLEKDVAVFRRAQRLGAARLAVAQVVVGHLGQGLAHAAKPRVAREHRHVGQRVADDALRADGTGPDDHVLYTCIDDYIGARSGSAGGGTRLQRNE